MTVSNNLSHHHHLHRIIVTGRHRTPTVAKREGTVVQSVREFEAEGDNESDEKMATAESIRPLSSWHCNCASVRVVLGPSPSSISAIIGSFYYWI